MNEKLQLTKTALELFMRYGIRSVSMDDLANELSISKKTLYKHFSTKDDLVQATLALEEETNRKKCEEVFKPENNAIDEVLAIGSYIAEHMKSINPSLIYDLKKYYPKSWAQFMERQHSGVFYQVVYDNIKKGQKQGLYRKRLNIEVITIFYLTRMSSVLDQNTFSLEEFSLSEIYFESLTYHIYGLASQEGRDYFESVRKSIKKKHYAV